MKKIIALVLLVTFLLPQWVFAQNAHTPNLNLNLPDFNQPGWGTLLNQNFSILDTQFPQGVIAVNAIYNQTTLLPGRHNLRFLGSGVSCGDNSIANSTDCTITSGGGGSAHVIQDEGSNLTQRPTLNFTGNLVVASDNAGQSRTDVTIGTTWGNLTNHGVLIGAGNSTTINATSAGTAGQCLTSNGASADPTFQTCAVSPSGNFTWTGTNTFQDTKLSIVNVSDATKAIRFDVSVITTATTRVYQTPNASTRLIGDSDFSTTGLMARTAANTYAGRTINTPVANEFILTNGDGVGGNPTLSLGTLVVKTNRANTWTVGIQDMSALAAGGYAFVVPIATSYAPTVAGVFGFNSTTSHFVGGNGTLSKIFPYSDEVQALNNNLTALSNITGVNNAALVFTGAGTMTGSVIPGCLDSAGNHLNYDNSAHTFSCGTSSTGGLSGLTPGVLTVATSATAIANSIVSQTTGPNVLSVNGGVVVGGGPYLIPDTTLIASSDKTWTIQNVSGIPCIATTGGGTITDGHVIKFSVSGGVTSCVDGGLAGSGTWTDASNNTSSGNKTIVDTAAGGTNTITIGLAGFWDGASVTLPSGTTCSLAAVTQINGGPSVNPVTCTTASTSTFEGEVMLRQAVATVTFTATVNDSTSTTHVWAYDFSAQCRNTTTTVNSSWSSNNLATVSPTVVNANYTAATSAFAPNGTCSAGATLFWRAVVHTATDTSDTTARMIGVLLKQVS